MWIVVYTCLMMMNKILMKAHGLKRTKKHKTFDCSSFEPMKRSLDSNGT